MARRERPKMADAAAAARLEHAEQEGEGFNAEDAWRSARIVARQSIDTYSDAMDALLPVFTEKVPTMGVDQYYRCYINPKYVEKLFNAAKQVSTETPCHFCGDTQHHAMAYIAGDIYHETQHALRKHIQRYKRGSYKNKNKANIAMDMEIDDDFLTLAAECHKDQLANRRPGPKLCYLNDPKTPLPPPPSVLGLPNNEIWEFYYENLPDSACDDGKSPGHVAPDGADYELGAPDDENPGISPEDATFIEQAVAKKVVEAHKRGLQAVGDMLDWARDKLPKSVYDWRKEFRYVRSAAGKIFGFNRRTFRKPHKKSAVDNYNTIHASRFQPKPMVHVLLDTSGSMGWQGRAQRALAELDKLLKQMRAKATIFCGDAETYKPQVISSLLDLKVRGGGGTSMRKCMHDVVAAAKKDNVNLIVLVTDGETDYPTKQEMQGIELIVCRINEQREMTHYPVPSFARDIWIPPHGQKVMM